MKTAIVAGVITLALFAVSCGRKTGGNSAPTGKAIATAKAGDLTATLSNSTGQLKQGDQEVILSFSNSSNQPVDVGAVSLNFHMPAMGSMAAMNDTVTFTTTGTPGVYRGKVNVAMAGEWQGQLAWEGAAGKGKTTFSVTAR